VADGPSAEASSAGSAFLLLGHGAAATRRAAPPFDSPLVAGAEAARAALDADQAKVLEGL